MPIQSLLKVGLFITCLIFLISPSDLSWAQKAVSEITSIAASKRAVAELEKTIGHQLEVQWDLKKGRPRFLEGALTDAGFVAQDFQNLVWAKRAGGTELDRGISIAVDGSGNGYVTGHFAVSATFGTGEPNETTLVSAGETAEDDIFVAKYGPNGELLWAKRAGGVGSDWGRSIDIDGSGNSYVTGFFAGSATFGAGETNETTLSSTGGDDIFVAKYSPNGELLWVKGAGGSESDWGSSIAIDGSGNSYVTGTFAGSATFGAGETNETTLSSAGSFDIFVARYGPNGNILWAKRAGGPAWDDGFSIAVDGSGNSYVTGPFADSATFGAGETNETTLSSVGIDDIFVAKYGPSGNLIWAKRAGGAEEVWGRSIAMDGWGNSYVTGHFEDFATFGAGETNKTTLSSAGSGDIFVALFSSGSTPTANTDNATNITTNSATLNGTVNPNGLSTTVKFEYGTTTSYGSEVTATQSPVSGPTEVPVSAELTGLTPNTTYHYRVGATNDAGTTMGADQTFATLESPTTVISFNKIWDEGQNWLVDTYDTHHPAGWNKAVDFYYASPQAPGVIYRVPDPGAVNDGRGLNVRAAHAGFAEIKEEGPFWCPSKKQNLTQTYLVITAPDGTFKTEYRHLQINPQIISSQVSSGDIIGWISNEGCAALPHLMFMVYRLQGTQWVPVSLDDPDGVLLDGEVIFSGPRALRKAKTSDDPDQDPLGNVYDYTSMPRRSALKVGDRVRVINRNDGLPVRGCASPSCAMKGTKVSGQAGVIQHGPVIEEVSSNRWVWYEIRWEDDGLVGWSAQGSASEMWLEKAINNVDVALVIDRSFSMQGQKLQDAKAAANTFVAFMHSGDNIAVVSFARTASVNFPLTTIISDETRTTAQNAINAITAGPATSVGAGMGVGQGELEKGDPNHPHAMLLLSDGGENTRPFVADVLPEITEETDIYTIGLGSDADQGLLSDIANTTGGKYRFAPTSAELQQIYLEILGRQQTLVTYRDTINPGDPPKSHNATIDALTSEANFILTFQGSDVDLELVTPSDSRCNTTVK